MAARNAGLQDDGRLDKTKGL
ncbi:hypothetical protein LEMLEM_LOCUS2538 [Lemmus lemmus]